MVLGYERASPDGSSHAIVLLNFSDQAQGIRDARFEDYEIFLSNDRCHLTGSDVRLGSYGAVVLLGR